MKNRFDTTLLLSGALCAALVSGCGGSGSSTSTAKETPKAPAPAAAPSAVKPAAPAAKATEPIAQTGSSKPLVNVPATAADATKVASDAATAAAQAALDKIPTQEELDAAAAKSISTANEDAEFDKLSKEIEKSDGK